jgi:hypothetical protein
MQKLIRKVKQEICKIYDKIPEDRVEKIINNITNICSCLSVRKTVYVRKVASLVGQIISTYSVIGKGKTRNL